MKKERDLTSGNITQYFGNAFSVLADLVGFRCFNTQILYEKSKKCVKI